ncbi:MAG: endonuclease/exonuclease/phosphatase family protein [Patescibacteria group bacterium]
MKLLTLNIWGGQVYEPLIEFIKSKRNEIDIFCFQEVLNGIKGEKSEVIVNAPNAVIDIYSQIKDILLEYNGYFVRTQYEEGLAIFIRKNISVTKNGDIFVYRYRDSMENKDVETIGRSIQYVEFKIINNQFAIVNFHGLWVNRGGKDDTPERIKQSRRIKKFLDNTNGTKILCGDFNLWPKTQSMAILEKEMKNLVKDYNIASTRSSLYSRFFDKNDRFADYILVSKDVKVLDFKVLPNEVSDHLPLFLEFN